jgi:hypothetical protein
LGSPVDLPSHFGFIQHWQLIGPFEGAAGIGFHSPYPPEKSVVLTAGYSGKAGQQLQWSAHTTADSYGVVDLNKAIGRHHGAVAYAAVTVDAPNEKPVQIRVGSNNAVKIVLNGSLLLGREEYHHGMRMDQLVGRGVLHAGQNQILLKVCQNEQTEDWAQSWSFQLRVCDDSGVAVPLTVVQSAGRTGPR